MTQKFDVNKAVIDAAKKVTNKRPKTVIDHIIEYGCISTEELKEIYGYNHPPRAARDVREEGIPLGVCPRIDCSAAEAQSLAILCGPFR